MDQLSTAGAAVVAGPETGTLITLGGTQHIFKLVSADTGGQYALMEATVQPHTLVIPHAHTHEDELAIVLDGEAGVRIEDQEFVVRPGSIVYIPRGKPHAIWNSSDAPSRAITIFSPAGLENMFVEMGAVYQASNPPDYARLGAISRQYGIVSIMDWVPVLSAKYGVTLG